MSPLWLRRGETAHLLLYRLYYASANQNWTAQYGTVGQFEAP